VPAFGPVPSRPHASPLVRQRPVRCALVRPRVLTDAGVTGPLFARATPPPCLYMSGCTPSGVVLLCAVLLVAGVVLQHKARRSALFAVPPGEVASRHVERGVSDGPVYPVGADSVGAAAPRRRYGMLSSAEHEDSAVQTMRQYAALHPVYHRCAKRRT